MERHVFKSEGTLSVTFSSPSSPSCHLCRLLPFSVSRRETKKFSCTWSPWKKNFTLYQSPAFHFCQSSMCGHPGVNNQVNAGYFPSIRTNLISRSKPDQWYGSSRPFPCSTAKAQAWANTAVAFRPLKINFLIYVSKTDKLLCDKKMKQVFFY